MDLSDCTTVNDSELINHSIKKSLKGILEVVKRLEKNDEDCLLCQCIFNIHNIHDLTRFYSLIMHCITYHCVTIDYIREEDLLITELFLLNFIIKRETTDITAIILYNNNNNEKLYTESLSNQLIALFQTHFTQQKIAFNCEQEIESLFYKYWKKLKTNKQTELLKKPKYLLFLLYWRKEHERFAKLFYSTKKDEFTIKLGILMNINDENTKEIDKLCLLYEKLLETRPDKQTKSDFEIFIKYCNRKYKLGLEDVYDLFDKSYSIKLWTDEKIRLFKWSECVRMWSKNRSDNSNYVDNSMIDLCIINTRFDEGWLIYINSFGNNTSGFNRAIRLCTTALRLTGNTKWRNRLFEIINDIFDDTNKVNVVCLLENLFLELENLSFMSLIKIINELHKKLINVKLDDEALEIIIRSYYNTSLTIDNIEISRKLCLFAMDLYYKWIKSKKKFYFFIKKTEFDTKIYSALLGICDHAKDCQHFYKVCRAILRNETNINREICRRLENFHTRNCKDCAYKTKQIVSVRESKGFISHLFK